MNKINLFWFRRDLRLTDNHGLWEALQGPCPVLPVFIFDTAILDQLNDPSDARVTFIHQELERIAQELEAVGAGILVEHGKPAEVWERILHRYPVGAVYTNKDYEPYAVQRDAAIRDILGQRGIPFHTFKDQVLFEEREVCKADGTPYTVFTPYSKAWKARLAASSTLNPDGTQVPEAFRHFPSERLQDHFWKTPPMPRPSLSELGFSPGILPFPERSVPQGLIKNYDKTRNTPAIVGTTHLGIHFRFGTLSIRQKARKASTLNETFLNELIWRDFYAMILSNFPRVATQAFRPEYDAIPWRNDPGEFERWCQGKTGYPIVDAGMRELAATGYMHNRVRMIVASFLTKHLLIDWRWGEAWFAEKLLDFDLASNNGGWQWAAGCGTDAAPYFRIFNPTAQQEKFDPDLKYVRKWVPEYGTPRYPSPVVDHKFARERCLLVYKEGIEKGKAQT
ncbi:MAG: cryptochrome/photolyase family protein [Haliscomenobacter sp.]